MMNLNKRRLLLTTAVCLLPIVAGLALYSRLPEQIATHFDFSGTPNGYSSRAFAVLGLPGIMAGLNALVQVLLCADPKRRNIGGAMMQADQAAPSGGYSPPLGSCAPFPPQPQPDRQPHAPARTDTG